MRRLHAGKDAKCRSGHSQGPSKIRAAYARKTVASEGWFYRKQQRDQGI
jgi:hypothetical protein